MAKVVSVSYFQSRNIDAISRSRPPSEPYNDGKAFKDYTFGRETRLAVY